MFFFACLFEIKLFLPQAASYALSYYMLPVQHFARGEAEIFFLVIIVNRVLSRVHDFRDAENLDRIVESS